MYCYGSMSVESRMLVVREEAPDRTDDPQVQQSSLVFFEKGPIRERGRPGQEVERVQK